MQLFQGFPQISFEDQAELKISTGTDPKTVVTGQTGSFRFWFLLAPNRPNSTLNLNSKKRKNLKKSKIL
jgi:hypothetical protein